MSPKGSKDHWTFLEEIEAPMWIDLTVEAKSNYHDMFHRCSSRQLKAAFAHSGEGTLSSDFDMKEVSSPKLPSSVSRSRGKHYATNKWGGDNADLQLKKQHPVKILNGKSLWTRSGYGDEIKPKLSFVPVKILNGKSLWTRSGYGDEIKPKLSFVNSKGASSRSLTRNARENKLRATSISRESETHPGSTSNKDNESNVSTITSESDHQTHQRNLDVSSGAFVQTSGLLSTMRMSLRKSCVTRQASRVVFNNDSKQLRGLISSSRKSSVGSSSNAAHDGKKSMPILTRKEEETPDSRNVARLTEATKRKVKVSTVSNVSGRQVKKQIYNSKGECTSNVTKSSKQLAAKSKDQNQTLKAKASISLKVNGQSSLAGANARAKETTVIGSNRLVGVRKENAAGRVSKTQTVCQVASLLEVSRKIQNTMCHRREIKQD
ncbi:hypothetical protein Tsubulata_024860 [Turnera subulata]|uniref:Uncharacterized protein n=1 Tax=Turnera subulata TaxID=218843 RepID=A0A9Q0JMS1_9ROSI|nr:hypothetical protein Tsubulata_024860 [Turnera subulata]